MLNRKKPFFSILIPTFNRPELVGDAIESVLYQSFDDLEVIVSNNGANTSTREVIRTYLKDERVKYYENGQALNMPEHWDKIAQEFDGKYFLILTDRCLLKQDALKFLYENLCARDNELEVISWKWDLYLDDMNILLRASRRNIAKINETDSTEYLLGLANYLTGVDYPMPRGMNSCVKTSFYKELQKRYGRVFTCLTPDVSFSFYCLMNTKSFWFVDGSLMISRGANVSNGGQTYVATTDQYIQSLGISDPIQNLPCKVPFLVNAVAEDFLRTAANCGRLDIYNSFCKTNYYVKLLYEWDVKVIAHKISFWRLYVFSRQIGKALDDESPNIQQQVKSQRLKSKVGKTMPFLRRVLVAAAIQILGRYLMAFRQRRILKNGDAEVFTDVRQAAGFS